MTAMACGGPDPGGGGTETEGTGTDGSTGGSMPTTMSTMSTSMSTLDDSGGGSADGDTGSMDTTDGDDGTDTDTGSGSDSDSDSSSTGAATCPGTAVGCVVDWAGQFNNSGNTDGVGGAAQFTNLAGISSDDTYVYVTANSAIRRIDKATATVETWAGASGQTGYVDATGTTARFMNPAGLATDGTVLWVADAGNAVVREVDLATAAVTTVAGQAGNPGSTDGTGGTFEALRDVAWDGSLLFVVQGNGVVRQVDVTDGDITTVAGQAGTNAFADGVGSVARFDVPRHIEAVGTGELYVGDTENDRVRHIAVAAGVGTVTTPYGSSAGYNDATGTSAQFDRLRGLAWDGGNVLVISDSDNFVIREANLITDAVITIAGMAGTNTHTEGIGLAAGFDKNLDMHFDADTGDLFISEGDVLRRMYYQ